MFQAVFYITGGISLLWCLCWFLFVHDTPEDHPYISDIERQMIIDSRTFDPSRETLQERSVPIFPLLLDALTSPPMLAIMACDFANSWGLYTLLTEGPTFLKDILQFDISEVILA